MTTPTTLLISTDKQLCGSIRAGLPEHCRARLEVVGDLAQARGWLDDPRLATLLVHVLPGADLSGLRGLLDEASHGGRTVGVVAICEEHDPAQALLLMQSGLSDYLTRPLNLVRLAYLIDVQALRWKLAGPRAAPAAAPACLSAGADASFLYGPGEMAAILEKVRTVAPLSTTVLLTGETGTGKTRLARLIHELSPRQGKPLVVVNCGAITPTLVESEMFGHVKGAFTGADADRSGKFAAAADGTLMLDEIDALSLETQARLLRAVDERVFEPVGSNRTLPLRARLIVASNRHLADEVAQGRFRSDLYYRVHVVSFSLPPLRDRRAILPALAQSFAQEFSRRDGRPAPQISAGAAAALEAYPWPGNIRELRNVIEGAVAFARHGLIEVHDLPQAVRSSLPLPCREAPSDGADGGSRWLQTKREGEARVIRDALVRNDHNRARAARELGMSRVTLYKKLHKYGMFGDVPS